MSWRFSLKCLKLVLLHHLLYFSPVSKHISFGLLTSSFLFRVRYSEEEYYTEWLLWVIYIMFFWKFLANRTKIARQAWMEDLLGPRFTSRWKVIKVVVSQYIQNLAPICLVKTSCTVYIYVSTHLQFAYPMQCQLFKVFWDIKFLSKTKGQWNRAKPVARLCAVRILRSWGYMSVEFLTCRVLYLFFISRIQPTFLV